MLRSLLTRSTHALSRTAAAGARSSSTAAAAAGADAGSKSGSDLLHALSGTSDAEIVAMVHEKKLSQHKLENELKRAVAAGLEPDCGRAVGIRRLWLREAIAKSNKDAHPETVLDSSANTSRFKGLPFKEFDYETFYQSVLGKNCENVIGYVPIPVGYVGPLLTNGKEQYVPMATTEGALLASTNRGCRAITESGGCLSTVYNDGMTRAPVVRMPKARDCAHLKLWFEEHDNFAKAKAAFDATSSYGRLESVKVAIAGRNCYLRFKSTTGDAMGMNMVSKGVLQVRSANTTTPHTHTRATPCDAISPLTRNVHKSHDHYMCN
jgi:hydroxymethylglutaryl-CoA reductase (NADPH)